MSNDDTNPLQSVYKVLAHLGVNPSDVSVNFDTGIDGVDPLLIALPQSKVGIVVNPARVGNAVKAGWSILDLDEAYVLAFDTVFRGLEDQTFEHLRRASQAGQVKTGSSQEEKLFSAILRANLPEPDRNFTVRRDDGTELTVPDFTWEDMRLAFYMDGLWWHRGKDDARMMNAITDAAKSKRKKKAFLDGERSRAQRDGDNRSELASMGWIILSCTDADLETREGVDRQVHRISQTMRTIRQRGMVSGASADVDPFA